MAVERILRLDLQDCWKGGVRMGSPLLPVGREMAEIPASFVALMLGAGAHNRRCFQNLVLRVV